MKTTRLPILLCHANCPECGLPTELKMFESGPGGDFETYLGADSGNIYRLDLGPVKYQGASRSDLLAEAVKREGRLVRVPEEIGCKICGTVFNADAVRIDGEETVDAYAL